jgi:hypothetical protein
MVIRTKKNMTEKSSRAVSMGTSRHHHSSLGDHFFYWTTVCSMWWMMDKNTQIPFFDVVTEALTLVECRSERILVEGHLASNGWSRRFYTKSIGLEYVSVTSIQIHLLETGK